MVADVITKPYQVNAKAALVAAVPIGDLGNAVICGYDHDIDTPYDDGSKGRDNPAPIPPNDPNYCHDNELGANDLPAMWCTQAVAPGKNAQQFGSPNAILQNQDPTTFYQGPWDCFNMTQAEFWSFVGAPKDPSSITDWNGLYYVDNNTVTRDASCSLSPSGVDGEGFLYVDGDLHLNSNFHYKGLIFVEGDLVINGNAWVLGSIVVQGRTTIRANGGMTVLYSKEAISEMLSKYGGQLVTLGWREK